ncbi:MAG: GNAT family N-acetyltransferase [Sedimentisphaerales bacterium]
MTMDDVALGLRLTQQAGWNQLESDWLRFLNLGPEGCFVAELDGRSVGTTMTFVSDRVAWVAMVLVEKESRGKGTGTALLKHALNYLDACKIKTIRLDATHLGQPIYEKLGFMPEYELVRFEGSMPTGLKTQHSRLMNRVLGLESEVLGPSLIEFDRRVTGENRAKMLDALFREYPQNVRVTIQGDRVEGFVTMRPGRNAIQIGPCVATEDAGRALLSDALNRCAGKAVFLDVPTDNIRAVKVAEASGLGIQRHFLRMYRGERVKDDVNAIWASSGPEKG